MIACQQQEEMVWPERCGEKQNHNTVQTFQSEDGKGAWLTSFWVCRT